MKSDQTKTTRTRKARKTREPRRKEATAPTRRRSLAVGGRKKKKPSGAKPAKAGKRQADGKAKGASRQHEGKKPGTLHPDLASFREWSGMNLVGGLVTIQKINEANRRHGESGLFFPDGLRRFIPTNEPWASGDLAPPVDASQPEAGVSGAAESLSFQPPLSPSPLATQGHDPLMSLDGDVAGLHKTGGNTELNELVKARPETATTTNDTASSRKSKPRGGFDLFEGLATLAETFFKSHEAAGESSAVPSPSQEPVEPVSEPHKPVRSPKASKRNKKGTGKPDKRRRESSRRVTKIRPVQLSESEERIALLRLVGLGPRSSRHHELAEVFESSFRQLWPGREQREPLITEIERTAWQQGALFPTRRLLCPSWVPTIAARSLFRRALADRCAARWDASEARNETCWPAKTLLLLLARLDPAVDFLHRSRTEAAFAELGVPEVVEAATDERTDVSLAVPECTDTNEDSKVVTAEAQTQRAETQARAPAEREVAGGEGLARPLMAKSDPARDRVTAESPPDRAGSAREAERTVDSNARAGVTPASVHAGSAHGDVRVETRAVTGLRAELLTVPEVAELAGRSRKTLYLWLKDPDSPLKEQVQLVGDKTRFRRAGLEEAIDRQKAMRQPRSKSQRAEPEDFVAPPESDQSTLAKAQRYFRRTRPLTRDELADFLGNSPSTISRWKCQRGLRAIHPGGRLLFDVEDAYVWLQKHKF